MKAVINKIKKNNGEAFAKAIKNYDNGIFEIPNIVEIVKHAGNEAEPLLNYLVSLKDIKIEKVKEVDFFGDLLDKAGYNFIVADTQEKQDGIKKYFKKGEGLCTFGTSRHKNYHIVNVWRKDVDNIKRENFKNPKRDDEYGTSVMSIQIAKKGGFISIKNRYNHKVSCCDNTLNSNPDNIILGLSDSLRDFFKVDFSSQKCSIKGNYHIIDSKILKYNYEISGVYIGKNAYFKDGSLVEIDKNKNLIIDYFLLDIPKKTIISIPEKTDGFTKAFNDSVKDKKLIITKDQTREEQEGEFVIIKDVE